MLPPIVHLAAVPQLCSHLHQPIAATHSFSNLSVSGGTGPGAPPQNKEKEVHSSTCWGCPGLFGPLSSSRLIGLTGCHPTQYKYKTSRRKISINLIPIFVLPKLGQASCFQKGHFSFFPSTSSLTWLCFITCQKWKGQWQECWHRNQSARLGRCWGTERKAWFFLVGWPAT